MALVGLDAPKRHVLGKGHSDVRLEGMDARKRAPAFNAVGGWDPRHGLRLRDVTL